MTDFNWKLSYKGSALVVSSGLLFFKQKKPKGLYLSDVLKMIEADPEAQYYSKVNRRRVTLAEAVRDDDLDSLGEVRDFYSAINLIDIKTDRVFKDLPRTGGDLLKNKYSSEPKKV